MRIAEAVQLVNGTEAWGKWQNQPLPLTLSVYIFNTTNPHEVATGRKPKLQELGPYVYEKCVTKVSIGLHEGKTTVTYTDQVHYFFRPDSSNGTEQDRVKVLNIPLTILASVASKKGVLAQMVVGAVLGEHEEEELFMDVTVEQLLFQGKYVPMMKTLVDTTSQLPALKNHTFGMFYPKNGSDEGLWQMRTGVGDPTQLGRIVSWNGKTELDFWPAQSSCNMMNGTNGFTFPPFLTRDTTLRVFYPDLCRSVYFKYTQDIEFHGIQGYRFALSKQALEDPRINKENACFCTERNRTECLRSGTIQLSACRGGAPVVMSTPHFLDGSADYVRMTEGLKPNREHHSTFIDVEPKTGKILRLHKRTQVNIDLKTNMVSDHFTGVPEILYPILWTDESMLMDEATQEAVKRLNL